MQTPNTSILLLSAILLFFFNDTPTTEIYTLSLHDALPICLTSEPSHNTRSSGHHVGHRPGQPQPPVARPAVPAVRARPPQVPRSEEHTSELQSRQYLVCRLLLEKKKNNH